MFNNEPDASKSRPAGYAALVERFDLDVVPHWRKSLVANGGRQRIHSEKGVVETVYPSRYWPGDGPGDHLEFALKYDGTNLAILSVLFRKIEEEDILVHVRSKPTGKYARRLR